MRRSYNSKREKKRLARAYLCGHYQRKGKEEERWVQCSQQCCWITMKAEGYVVLSFFSEKVVSCYYRIAVMDEKKGLVKRYHTNPLFILNSVTGGVCHQ